MVGKLVVEPRAQSYAYYGAQFDPPLPAPEFALVNQDGKLTRLSDYRGKPVLVFFGFTNCRNVCPMTMARWRQVHSLLKGDAEKVGFVFITIDPERDTPEQLKAFLSKFNSAFVGLTGTHEEIEDTVVAFSAFFRKEDTVDDAADEVRFIHTSLTYVVDRNGVLRLAFPAGAPAPEMAADLTQLLKQ